MKVFLSIFAIIFLLGLIRLRVSLEYAEHGFSAIVKLLFFRFRFPRGKSDKKAPTESGGQ